MSAVNKDEGETAAQAADALRRAYDLRRAEDTARAGLRQFPDSAALWMALGRVLILEHRPEEALTCFAAAASPRAACQRRRYPRGQLWLRLGYWQVSATIYLRFNCSGEGSG